MRLPDKGDGVFLRCTFWQCLGVEGQHYILPAHIENPTETPSLILRAVKNLATMAKLLN